MNNILSYCGLVDARICGSEKDLPVIFTSEMKFKKLLLCWAQLNHYFISAAHIAQDLRDKITSHMHMMIRNMNDDYAWSLLQKKL